LPNSGAAPAEILLDLPSSEIPDSAPGVDHAVDSDRAQILPVSAERFPDPALVTVAENRLADPPGHRDTEPMIRSSVGQVKEDEPPPDDLSASVVDPAKFG
jgi:hypothetical protein